MTKYRIHGAVPGRVGLRHTDCNPGPGLQGAGLLQNRVLTQMNVINHGSLIEIDNHGKKLYFFFYIFFNKRRNFVVHKYRNMSRSYGAKKLKEKFIEEYMYVL